MVRSSEERRMAAWAVRGSKLDVAGSNPVARATSMYDRTCQALPIVATGVDF